MTTARRFLFSAVILLLASLPLACGNAEPSAAVPAAAFAPAESDAFLFGELFIKGNDEMVPLLAALAGAFEAEHPDAVLSVSGGGTEQGLAAVINGTVQIAASKREMTSYEAAQCEALGGRPIPHIIAREAAAVVVNRTNPLSTISQPDLAEILKNSGRITNWSALGGQNLPITIYLYDDGSGLLDFMRTRLLEGEDFKAPAEVIPDYETLFARINADLSAVGLASYGRVPASGINMLEIGAGEFFVPASITTILSERYPFTRTLYLYTNGAANPLARSFIHFVQGPPGQAILLEFGLIPAAE